MSNTRKYQLIALAVLAAYGTRDRWMKKLDDGGGGDNSPPVVTTSPFPEITATLKADDNPERVRILRDLSAGMAAVGVPRAANLIAVERCVQTALDHVLPGTTSSASGLVSAEFAKVIEGMPLTLDGNDRAKVAKFYADLSIACARAL